LGQQGLVGVTALKEKLLLSFGIVCILFGAVGVCAVGVAYYYTERALNGLPSDIEWLFLVSNQTTSDATTAVANAAASIMTAANQIDVNILGVRPFGDTANSLRQTASSVMIVAGDVNDVSGYLEELKNILLDEISSIRLTIQITFSYIGVLQALFIMIGVSILQIRKSLQSVISRASEEDTSLKTNRLRALPPSPQPPRSPSITKRYCTKCGTELPVNAGYCSSCGQKREA